MFTRIRLTQRVTDNGTVRSLNAGMLYPMCIHQALEWKEIFDRLQPFEGCRVSIELIFPKHGSPGSNTVALDDLQDIAHVLREAGLINEPEYGDKVVAARPTHGNGLHMVQTDEHHDRNGGFARD
jgi:hypothetical protein